MGDPGPGRRAGDRGELPGFLGFIMVLAVYWLGPGKSLARLLPSPADRLVDGPDQTSLPLLIVWGLICAGVISEARRDGTASPEASLFLSFPSVMLVAGVA